MALRALLLVALLADGAPDQSPGRGVRRQPTLLAVDGRALAEMGAFVRTPSAAHSREQLHLSVSRTSSIDQDASTSQQHSQLCRPAPRSTLFKGHKFRPHRRTPTIGQRGRRKCRSRFGNRALLVDEGRCDGYGGWCPPRSQGVHAVVLLRPPRCALRTCLLYTSPSPRDRTRSRMPSSA